MARVCHFSGKRTVVGGRLCRRGLAKKFGGVGSRIIAHNKRKFRPNLQKMRIVGTDGRVKRVWVATSEIKAGKVTRPAKRRWKPEAKTA
ncbi:MAG: 50S ribosomal protein L28 [Planctomycetes bacterium]|nr:50S ribosomal protein L28 [Planctomycetota bacterium]NUQ35925.1 50S ribosomal protein L28 [Planctomycetaceae bacterium]